MMFDMKALERQFSKEYRFLYEADVEGRHVAGYDEALAFGESLIEHNHVLAGEFVGWRGDFLGSDREVAAFAYAVGELGWI